MKGKNHLENTESRVSHIFSNLLISKVFSVSSVVIF